MTRAGLQAGEDHSTRLDEPQQLIPGVAGQPCRVSVTIPARNEEALLPRCLDALLAQVDLDGNTLPPSHFEIVLLLNNCTDRSAAVAGQWQAAHPHTCLHIAERDLPSEQAHVGTARRLLMDTAWRRLRGPADNERAILSTDADTVIAPDWIAQNLRALQSGAEVVGGCVELLPGELDALPPAVRHCYRQDRHYAALVARLEDLLDPQPGDRWPRHLDHFGSSLACTVKAYAASGGMPELPSLEDEAFIDRVRRADLRLRHEPAVRVYTSARVLGRASGGMAGQFGLWCELPGTAAHTVPAACFLEHRFRTVRKLRKIFAAQNVGNLALPTDWWRDTFRNALRNETTCPGFLGAVYCDILIAESFNAPAEETIAEAITMLEVLVARLEPRPLLKSESKANLPLARPLARNSPQPANDVSSTLQAVASLQ